MNGKEKVYHLALHTAIAFSVAAGAIRSDENLPVFTAWSDITSDLSDKRKELRQRVEQKDLQAVERCDIEIEALEFVQKWLETLLEEGQS